jgi:hypothetical protein
MSAIGATGSGRAPHHHCCSATHAHARARTHAHTHIGSCNNACCNGSTVWFSPSGPKSVATTGQHVGAAGACLHTCTTGYRGGATRRVTHTHTHTHGSDIGAVCHYPSQATRALLMCAIMCREVAHPHTPDNRKMNAGQACACVSGRVST